MESKPLVSGIIVFFNAARFLQESIESVLAQTYENWELLLVDDGSTDGSTEIAQRHVRQYSGKVYYVEHEGHQNRGMSAARNLGVKNARGKYITFLDADDIWLPHSLEEQVAILECQPKAAAVYGRIQFWFSWSGKPQDIQRDYIERLGFRPNTLVKPPLLFTRFLRGQVLKPTGALIRRELIAQVGGFEESFCGMFEDCAFFAKVCLKAPIFAVNRCWYLYRQHADSCCSVARSTGQVQAARMFYLKWLEGYLFEQGVENREVWQALRGELWPYRHPVLSLPFTVIRSLVSRLRRLLRGELWPYRQPVLSLPFTAIRSLVSRLRRLRLRRLLRAVAWHTLPTSVFHGLQAKSLGVEETYD